jgi:hypothetical protein
MNLLETFGFKLAWWEQLLMSWALSSRRFTDSDAADVVAKTDDTAVPA